MKADNIRNAQKYDYPTDGRHPARIPQLDT